MYEAYIRRWRLLLAVPAFFFSARTAVPQIVVPVFWELQPQQVEDMLLHIPDSDNHRYLCLRQYFSELHCTPALMEEQTISNNRKNLLCLLPGKDSDQIIVAARYERRRDRPGEGWDEAVMLPILYNALRAQARQHTFVFAAVEGGAGEKKLMDQLHRSRHAAVQTIVVLDSLGLSGPRFVTPPQYSMSATDPDHAAKSKLLASEAAFAANLEGISIPVNERPSRAAVENTLLFRAAKIPSILVYSDSSAKVSLPAFHKEFDFLAYYLCRIDFRLTSPGPSTNR